MPTLQPGDPVTMRYTKWDGRRHHGATLRYLGEDTYGQWLADPVGNEWSGGPISFVTEHAAVLCIFRRRGSVALFHGPTAPNLRVYVDVTTIPVWDGAFVTAIDLDLDVCQRRDGTVFVDDEDEFAEHQLAFGYPAEVIAAAEAEAARLVREVAAATGPFRTDVVEAWRLRADQLLT